MTKRIQDIIALLKRSPAEPQEDAAEQRLMRMAAAEAKRSVKMTPLAAR